MQPTKANDAGASRVVQGSVRPGAAQPPDTLHEEPIAGKRPRLLCERVDWVTVAFALDFSSEAISAVRRAAAAADEHGTAPLQIGPFIAEVKRSTRSDRFHWKNGDFVGVIDLSKRHALEITASGAYCAQVANVRAVLAQMGKIVDALGVRDAKGETIVQEARLRRFDLCADFVDFDVDVISRHALLLPRGTKKKGVLARYDPGWQALDGDDRAQGFIPDDEQSDDRPETRSYSNAAQQTGHTICAGSVVMGRIYNKTIELDLGSEDKRAVEEQRWSAHGRKKGEPVTRVEFQLRGEALDEAELRDPAKLFDALDSVWAYLTRKWIRLIVEGSATRRHRCDTDDRWRAVQELPRFARPGAEPIVRRRRRAGASSAQALGAMLSSLSSSGRLMRIHDSSTFDVPRRGQEQPRPTEADARKFLQTIVVDAALSFAQLAVDDLLRGRLAVDVTEHVVTKISASWARAHSTIASNDVAPRTWHVQLNDQTRTLIAYEVDGVERCWPPLDVAAAAAE